MNIYLHDAYRTVVPAKDDPHGPLPAMLVMLTFVTGLVDAFSYLDLRRVFVANMTGNVVFLSFALGGARGFLWWASLLGVLTFLTGALVGGRIHVRFASHRGRLLLVAATVQAGLMIAALVCSFLFPRPYVGAGIAVLIVVLGVAMGLQNAAARALGVPDMTTTVLTMTLTGISADSRAAGGTNSRAGRRLVSVASMFVGGLVGAVLIVAGHPRICLLLAVLLLVVIASVAIRLSRSQASWTAKP